MPFSQISIQNFRNFEAIEVQPISKGINILAGDNGSGKTSFLEAIYLLSHGRSFRSIAMDGLIRHGFPQFLVMGQFFQDNNPQKQLGIQSPPFKANIDGQTLDTLSQLSKELPLRFLNVHTHFLIEGGPEFRRKYLDWGLFYHCREFHDVWTQFKRVLNQRNAALRARKPLSELKTWTQQFIEKAEMFHTLRIQYFNQLTPLILEKWHRILELNTFKAVNGAQNFWSIEYSRGWTEDLTLAETLERRLTQDVDRGFTQEGPHRADFKVKLNGFLAKEILSTGQQKLLVCGMILAQGAHLKSAENKEPIYMIDDLPSELDEANQHWLLNEMIEQKAQVFATAIEFKLQSALDSLGTPAKMFHVKHGRIREA